MSVPLSRRGVDRRLSPRLLTAGAVGTGLEFYDLTVYGMLAATLAPLFFPSDSPTASLIASFAAFAVGLIARVAGGLLFGWFADRFDRRTSLIASIVLMAASCGLLALLPTYDVIGVAAPILLVGLRMVQGLAVGGELGVSYVYIGEHAPAGRRALAMSPVGMGTTLGILLGAAVVAALHIALTEQQISSFGWRIAFGLGVVVAFVGLLVRRQIDSQVTAEQRTPAIWTTFAHHAGRVALNILALAGIAGCFFCLFFFIPTWAVRTLHAEPQAVHLTAVLAALLILLSLPLCGWLADWIGARTAGWISALALAAALYPLISNLSATPSSANLAIVVGLAVLQALYIAAIAALTFGLYVHAVRGLSFSFVFNVAYGAIGGTTPMICVWLNEVTAHPLAFVWYLIGLSIISALALIKLAANP